MYNSSIGMNIYFVVDVSGSMHGVKIEQVNALATDILPLIQDLSEDYSLDTFLRVLSFGEGFSWHIGSLQGGKNISSFNWKPLTATARKTETAKAVYEVINSLKQPKKRSGHGNVIFLITDGKCTEKESDYFDACQKLSDLMTENDLRLSIALEGSDRHELETFTKNANNIFTLNDIDAMRLCLKSCFEYYGSISVVNASAPADTEPDTTDDSEDIWI